jgi:DNA polymerase-3 subunit delta
MPGMEALTFLERLDKATPLPFYVLHEGDAFLARQVLLGLRKLVLGPDDDGVALSTYPGDKATWAAVIDELRTLPFLAPRRLVVVEQADPFVSRERPRLEKFVAEAVGQKDPKGVLVLCVGTWAGNTNLAKRTPDQHVIVCEGLASEQLPRWCVDWCARRHGKGLTPQAARLLVDLVGTEMGLLDSEIEKLAVYAGSAPKIDAKDVDELVGRSRTEEIWGIFELIGAGKAGEALTYLDHLLIKGEYPVKLLGALGSRLGQLAQATRLNAQGVPLQEALTRVKVPNYHSVRKATETQMKHLGRRRLDQLYDWLLETDQGLKGGSQLPPRVLLERLVVRLARTRS